MDHARRPPLGLGVLETLRRDGRMPATLEAVKTFQRGKGMPVDGFPSRTILEMLRKEG